MFLAIIKKNEIKLKFKKKVIYIFLTMSKNSNQHFYI